MLDQQQEALSSTFLEIVEQLTFMFGEPADKQDMEVEDVDFTTASMSFTGDLPGSLTVVVDSSILLDIAANILGIDPEDVAPDTMMPDALGEMLNVICGHVIMALAGTGANFKLGPPAIGTATSEFVTQVAVSADYVGFLLDDSPVFLGFTAA